MNSGMSGLKQALVGFLNIEWTDLLELSRGAPFRYKRFEIPKSRGEGKRTVFQPCPETKAIQRAIVSTLLDDLPVNSAAYAYRRGLSNPLLEQAKIHAPFPYTIRVDIRSFFPSIRPRDLLSRLEKTCVEKLDLEIAEFLECSLFVRYPRSYVGLAIGAPSSPSIANYVMNEIDADLSRWASTRQGVYTRYADDLVFSSKTRLECRQFLVVVRKVLADSTSPKLELNDTKTLYSAIGLRRFVTGLCITDNGQVTIGRARKRYYRMLISKYVAGQLEGRAEKGLKGYLSFARSIEPAFINSCVLKYGATPMRALLSARYDEPSDGE